tara:strand:- start:228 stop:530 length:303 start_codon:yes stop_codon:yes gene_type:complete
MKKASDKSRLTPKILKVADKVAKGGNVVSAALLAGQGGKLLYEQTPQGKRGIERRNAASVKGLTKQAQHERVGGKPKYTLSDSEEKAGQKYADRVLGKKE